MFAVVAVLPSPTSLNVQTRLPLPSMLALALRKWGLSASAAVVAPRALVRLRRFVGSELHSACKSKRQTCLPPHADRSRCAGGGPDGDAREPDRNDCESPARRSASRSRVQRGSCTILDLTLAPLRSREHPEQAARAVSARRTLPGHREAGRLTRFPPLLTIPQRSSSSQRWIATDAAREIRSRSQRASRARR